MPAREVAVHWDVLESGPVTRAERFYEKYTDHLIASDSYGELVPYIGGRRTETRCTVCSARSTAWPRMTALSSPTPFTWT